MHPRRFDILTALRNPEYELRVSRNTVGTYSAEIARSGHNSGSRVAYKHVLGVVRDGDVELVGEAGPGRAAIYRLSERARDRADPEQRETTIITTCALRFDGYRYIEEERIGTWRELDDGSGVLDLEDETERFFTHPDYGAPPDYLRMMLFLVQRKFMREGWLRWESQIARMTRQLFIRTCRDDVPAHLRFEDWATEWDRDFSKYAKDHVRFVERRDQATVYDEHLF